MHRTKVRVVEDALDANNTIARANREDFDRAGVTVVNLMSAPGAGKTSLLERVAAGLEGVRLGVLEGDVQGSLDADRLASLHVPVTQLNTDPGFGGAGSGGASRGTCAVWRRAGPTSKSCSAGTARSIWRRWRAT